MKLEYFFSAQRVCGCRVIDRSEYSEKRKKDRALKELSLRCHTAAPRGETLPPHGSRIAQAENETGAGIDQLIAKPAGESNEEFCPLSRRLHSRTADIPKKNKNVNAINPKNPFTKTEPECFLINPSIYTLP